MHPAARLLDTVAEASVVGSFSSLGHALRTRIYDWPALDGYDLAGRTVLVTGANSGLGKAIAEQLARLGAAVRVSVRSDDKGERTVADLVEASGNPDVRYGVMDLARFDTVDAFAAQLADDHERLDAVVHNAGAMFDERTEVDAEDVAGTPIEKTIAVHVAGPFRLTTRLLPLLRANRGADDPARVVTMSSGGMYAEKLRVRRLESPKDYRPSLAYARAKRAQVVLTDEWARRLGDDGRVVFHVMHPGWAATPGVERSLPGFNKVVGPILREPLDGGETAVWLVADPRGKEQQHDRIWLDRRPRSTHKLPTTRHEPSEADLLWDTVVDLAGVDPQADTHDA